LPPSTGNLITLESRVRFKVRPCVRALSSFLFLLRAVPLGEKEERERGKKKEGVSSV
jgi:hypothetical protein